LRHSSQREIDFFSSVPSPLTPSKGSQRFAEKFVCRQHKHAVWLRVANVDYSQVSAARGPANCDAAAVPPRAIFPRIGEDLFDLLLIHIMIPDVRLTCCSIEVEAQIHRQHPV
jgi:hypothetical protein